MSRVDTVSLSRFVTIAEYRSFRAAAKALYVAQPTLTKQMQHLEASLGTTLFERGRWGVRLTVQGEALLGRARAILEDVAELPKVIATPREVVRVGAAATAAGSFLAPFLGKWIPSNPDVEVRLVNDGLNGLVDRLRSRECDVALVGSPVPREFAYKPIKEVQLQVVLPDGHPLADTDAPLPLTALAELPILLNGDSFRATELFRAACKVAGIAPPEVYNSAIGQTLAALVKHGLGVAVLADSVDLRGFDLPRRILVVDGYEPLRFVINVAYHQREYTPPGLARFVRDLLQAFAKAAP